MKNAEFNKMTKTLIRSCLNTLTKKGYDYANKDRLSNFKAVAQSFTFLTTKYISPDEVTLILQLTKIARLYNLLYYSKTPKNESLKDTMKDLLNYVILQNNILEERKAL